MAVRESPESNDVAALAASVLLLAASPGEAKPTKPSRPELVVTKVSKPGTLSAGSKLSLLVEVRNKGRAKAGRNKVGVYLGTGKKRRPKDGRLARAAIKPLGAGKHTKARLQVTIPVGTAAGLHRLFVCADDTRAVRESKESDNCTASAGFQLAAAAPAPAFSVNDGFDWGLAEDAEGKGPIAAEPISVTMRAANGIAGQSGYSVSKVAPMPMVGGTVTTLDFTGKNLDDSGLTVQLPFAFPFGGIDEHAASISTNGRIAFGSPAADWWDDGQERDYRGSEFVAGNFERAIMPYWSDLDLTEQQNTPPGTIKEVVAGDGSFVAFQWDIQQRSTGTRRTFQLVLFPDGHFRFDYPGENPPGGNSTFIGYSLGTGVASLEALRIGTTSVPSGSLQFVPNPVPAAGSLGAGQLSLTLPAGSAFVSGDAGCSVSTPPTDIQAGLASCGVPALPAGAEAARTVTFAMPANAIGQARPANFRYLGTYSAGGVALTDLDELNALESRLSPTRITPTVAYVAPPANPKVGQAAQFTVTLAANDGLDTPSMTLRLPADTVLNSVQIGGKGLPCGPPAAGEVSCQLPSGMRETKPPITVTVTPTVDAAGKELTLEASAQALNAALATGSGKSPAVEP